jgi:hypothetical protein
MVKVEVVPDFYLLGVNPEDLPDLRKVLVIGEKCNCYELYGAIKHVDGGNYHSMIVIYEVPDTDYYIFRYGNTREDFCGDEYHGWVVLINDEPRYSFFVRSDESYALYDKEKAQKIIRSYEADENYYINYCD